ncbi:MAG: 2-oxoacid:ferredoxin oxidoreductase subunit beta [Rhodomicrobium sp.]
MTMTTTAATTTAPARALTPADYASTQEVRWCPGCGDYSIIKAVQRALSEIQAKPEDTVFVSGIGCSSRFPYYIETYGYHTIHGRAPAVATGIKLANPDLDVWIVTGDGDGLSIGGNHMAHLLRRNLDCQVLLFNNEIYGLTKGQYSPTSRQGTRSPSTPFGSVEQPANPSSFALGAGGRFVARVVDVAQKELLALLKRARANKGTSFVEIYQNCAVFNDGVFAAIADKKSQPNEVVWVEHGKPMLFAKGAKGLRLNREHLRFEVVDVAGGDWQAAGVFVHDETSRTIAQLLIDLPQGGFPVALGVLYCDPAQSFDAAVAAQHQRVAAARKPDLAALLRSGETWSIGGDASAA